MHFTIAGLYSPVYSRASIHTSLIKRPYNCFSMFVICILYIYIKRILIMDASILDLRYRMREVLNALDRREKIRVLYRGKVKGTIIPSSQKPAGGVKDHPLFGIHAGDTRSVADVMRELRKGRYDDI